VTRIYDLHGLKGMLRLIKLIRKERFDIVHSYLFNENILGSIAAKIAKAPVIITSRRDTGIFFEKKPYYFLMYRLTNRLVHKIICVSEAVKKAVVEKENVSFDKLAVIYNGVDTNKLTPDKRTNSSQIKSSLNIRDDDFVVGMISNANSSVIKGQKDFIESARIVSQEIPNTKFLLVGGGPLTESLKLQAASFGLQDKFLFLGTRRDIPELLSVMDISVNASYSEGMSNTILQSMASGVPVVATAVDGNLETVVDGVTGILVPHKNPQRMAEAIIKILKNRELAKKMGENARKVIEEKFTNQIMLGNMENLYKRLLKRKVAFIFSQFPCYDETFILREMNELKAAGLDFVLYSIKPCKDKVIHQEAGQLAKITSYLPLISFKLIFINLFFALRHPFRYWSTFLQVFFVNLKSLNFFLKSIGLWMQTVGFAWLAKRDKVFHVHGQWATFPTTHAFIISKLNNIPFSFTGHAHDIFVDTVGLKQKISMAKFIVTCTEYNKKYLLNLLSRDSAIARAGDNVLIALKDKIIVNYHGVDLEKFDSQDTKIQRHNDTGSFKILSVGSLLECKGFDILINACKILKDKGLNFECTIAGGGPLREALEQKVRDFGLDGEVKFTGYITQDKLIPLYLKADILSLSMRSKIHWGIPNVLLEAAAAKVPVICTHLPSIPELVENNKTGFIVPEDNPKALAEALLRLYRDKELGKEIGIQGYTVIRDKFEIKKNAMKLIELFKLNVLFVIPSLELGGAERVVINLAKGLDRKIFNPMVCCLNEKGRFAEELEKEKIKVIALNKKGPLDLSIISKLVKVMKKNQVDVVNTHLWGANFWGRIAAQKAGVKTVIATEHNVDVCKNWLYFVLDRWLSYKTDKIITVSKSVKEFYVSKGIPEKKIEVVYNGIDIKQIRPSQGTSSVLSIRHEFGISTDEKVLAVIGRLVPQKGHKYLFDALYQLDGRYNVKLLVVGDGPLKEDLQSTVHSQQLNDKVIFTGLRKDISEILGITDILVMPSTREGFGMVLAEANACNKPVVAYDIEGVRDVVQSGKNGILVQPNNVNDFAKAIIELLSNEKLCARMGA
ncbi:MAG: glycosyltransferase, partial [Candidatus Omnitrophica bacterium]|nr:glycosyltransferase [Candidatus Omnitrophota bacterium]